MMRQAAIVAHNSDQGEPPLFSVFVREQRRAWWGGLRWGDWLALSESDDGIDAWELPMAEIQRTSALDTGWIKCGRPGFAHAILSLSETEGEDS